MAESDISRLSPHANIERAAVNRVGPGWDYTGRVERQDFELNLPLRDVRFDQPPQPVAPPPTPPTEAELRALLAEALKTRSERETALHRAEAVHQRAEEHLARCRVHAAAYAGLNDAITASVTEALRCSAGVLQTDLSEEHELALSDKTRAVTELSAAAAALNVFRQERADAAQAVGDVSQQVDALVGKVIACRAEEMALQHEALLAQAAEMRSILLGFDRYVTPLKGVGIPPVLRGIYATMDSSVFGRIVDTTAWRAAADALRADPHAEVTIMSPQPPKKGGA